MATLSAMRLSDYLARENLSAAEFGRRTGAARSTVIRWMSGERSPNSAAMRAIAEATGGKVQPNDFFDPAPQPAADEAAA